MFHLTVLMISRKKWTTDLAFKSKIPLTSQAQKAKFHKSHCEPWTLTKMLTEHTFHLLYVTIHERTLGTFYQEEL